MFNLMKAKQLITANKKALPDMGKPLLDLKQYSKASIWKRTWSRPEN